EDKRVKDKRPGEESCCDQEHAVGGVEMAKMLMVKTRPLLYLQTAKLLAVVDGSTSISLAEIPTGGGE
ncbi:MAG: hypothetical protein V3S55_09030, partial [Nitrospiraceae bacterium]